MENKKAGKVPPFYKNILLEVFDEGGTDETLFSKITIPGLRKILDSSALVVRSKGQTGWAASEFLHLSDGLHLEAKRLGIKVPLADQEVQGWKQHCIEGTENRAAERAVEALRALGGTNVERYCGPHKITRPRSNQVVLELDGAAICDEAVLLVESKTHLVIEDVTDLIMRMDKLEDLANEEGLPQLSKMKGKPLLGALAAETVPANPGQLQRVLNRAAATDIELWLPDCSGMGVGDSCIASPHQHKPFKVAQPSRSQTATTTKKAARSAGAASKRRPAAAARCSMHAPFSRGTVYACL